MLNGTGATSLRKQDLTDQKNIGTGFVKTQFAHQCSGGETGINLNSLTIPSQMSANGFTNPSGAQLAAANLTTYRKNLRLTSSLRGVLTDYLSYTVSATGTQITFIGFTAQPGEIFVGTLDYTAVNGIQVVSATGQPATGVLAAETTDFNIGFPVPTNQYSTTQLGGVLVYLDGVLQTRNTGNSSSTLDGTYYEVDNGSGNFSVVRFNVADPVNARNVLVVPNGLLVPQPDGSLLTTVQAQAGQINQLAAYVAALTGLSTTSVLGGAASYTDLLAFGNLVNTINNNFASKNAAQTFIGLQTFSGGINRTGDDAVSVHSGDQTLTQAGLTPVAFASVDVDITSAFASNTYTCKNAGTYRVAFAGSYEYSSGTVVNTDAFIIQIRKNNSAVGASPEFCANITGAVTFLPFSSTQLVTLNVGDTITIAITPDIAGGHTASGTLRGMNLCISKV